MGMGMGMGSRTSSSDIDNMRSIPMMLRSRISGAVGTQLPELGALLGRGSFGKVYKGDGLHCSWVASLLSASCSREVLHHEAQHSSARCMTLRDLKRLYRELLQCRCCAAAAVLGPAVMVYTRCFSLLTKPNNSALRILCISNCLAFDAELIHCAGRWKGAMVAVKIIEHSADINSKMEGFRETMVSSNIQHPNVVSLLIRLFHSMLQHVSRAVTEGSCCLHHWFVMPTAS